MSYHKDHIMLNHMLDDISGLPQRTDIFGNRVLLDTTNDAERLKEFIEKHTANMDSLPSLEEWRKALQDHLDGKEDATSAIEIDSMPKTAPAGNGSKNHVHIANFGTVTAFLASLAAADSFRFRRGELTPMVVEPRRSGWANMAEMALRASAITDFSFSNSFDLPVVMYSMPGPYNFGYKKPVWEIEGFREVTRAAIPEALPRWNEDYDFFKQKWKTHPKLVKVYAYMRGPYDDLFIDLHFHGIMKLSSGIPPEYVHWRRHKRNLMVQILDFPETQLLSCLFH